MIRDIRGAAGEDIVSQGEPLRGLLLVVSGYVKLCESRADGTERVVGFRVPGEILGFEALAAGRSPHRAVALTEVRMCRLKWRGNPEAGVSTRLLTQLLRNAASQLSAAENLAGGLTAAERVGNFLADFNERARGGIGIATGASLPMTRADIGSYLGLSEETVVRTLKRLRNSRQTEAGARGLQ